MFFINAALLLCLCGSEAVALKLTSKRVIFEGRKRAENIVVINTSNSEEVYRVGWRNMVMSESGNLEHKPLSPEELDIKDNPFIVPNMVRYAPRRFVVPARSSQQLRIILRTPPGLPDGEYRSHLYISTEKSALENKDVQRSGVQILARPGATIPVFIRKGQLSSEISFNDLSASYFNGDINVRFDIARTGNKSMYGSLDLVCNAGSRNGYVLRSIKNLAIYTDVERRAQTIRLPIPEGQPQCQSVRAKFFENINKGNKRDRVFLVEETAVVQ